MAGGCWESARDTRCWGERCAIRLASKDRRPLPPGLGLLDIETTMGAQKTLRRVSGEETTTGARIDGYEMHIGISTGDATQRPMVRFEDGSLRWRRQRKRPREPGATCTAFSTHPPIARRCWQPLGARSSGEDHAASVDAALDEVAATLERALNVQSSSASGPSATLADRMHSRRERAARIDPGARNPAFRPPRVETSA